MGNALKVMTILGTRPEIIRLSRVMALLDEHVEHRIVHTGQNYDFELNEIFFRDLKVRKPDYFLGIDCSTLGRAYGNILIGIEDVLIKERPDAVLVLGDTNSAIAAIMAKRMKIPVYHMESGNRCFDFNVPEETNRRIIDHISDYNMVYTEHARRNLLREGLHPRRIYLTGSPMKEVLMHYMDRFRESAALGELGLEAKKYFLVSAHREENVDNRENLMSVLSCLNRLVEEFGLPVIVSTHPRTRKRIEALPDACVNPGVSFMKPFGFHDYINLQMNAFCTLSDSGTISEESAVLKFPAVTIRNSIERPEAMDAGCIILAGLRPETVIPAVRMAVSSDGVLDDQPIPAEYEITNVSQRAVKLIIGTAGLSHMWDGIKVNS